MNNYDKLPYANDGAYFTQEKAKIEAEAQKRIFLHKNGYVEFYKVENTLEIQLKNITLADIGISTINTIFASITQGLDELKRLKLIDKIGVARFVFVIEDLLITFTYNDGTKEVYKGVANVVFAILTIFATYIIVAIIDFFISTWWIAILVAAFIALIASIFANTQWEKTN